MEQLPTGSGLRAEKLLLSVCILSSAALLLVVEPLVARELLPWFGGSASVWTTCLLFFQTMLLAGYAYSHGVTCHLSPRAQLYVHLCLIAAALLMLPVSPPQWLTPTASNRPAAHLLLVLLFTVGVPFFLLSSTGTLVQAWWVRLNPISSPYRLYALSNVGSLGGLLAYPFLVEPLLTLKTQIYAWSAAMVLFAVLCAVCSFMAAKAPATVQSSTGHDPRPPATHRLMWMLWPACAVVLLMSVTASLTQNIAPAPFLWVLPLALYLLSFIVTFDRPRWYRRALWMPLFGLFAMAIAWVMIIGPHRFSLAWLLAIYNPALFAGCMICHGELHRLRPSPRRLTSFYLSLSLGGAIGGALAAIAAPLLLNGIWELHIGIGVCCLLCMITLWTDTASPLRFGKPAIAWVGIIALLTILLGLLANDTGPRLAGGRLLHRSRNFYGMLSVWEVERPDRHYRLLEHGGIAHGIQRLGDEQRSPAGYYLPESGIGRILQIAGRDRGIRVGITGLGAGSLAAWARPQDTYRFYEIDPQVVIVAHEYFSYLSGSPSPIDVLVGDARLIMQQEPPQAYDVIVLDAFSGDAVPTHLLTIEAMRLYQRHLADGGILAINITNRYLDLAPVVSRLARELSWQSRIVTMEAPADDPAAFANRWAILSGDSALFDDPLLRDVVIEPTARPSVGLWTDGYASILPILK